MPGREVHALAPADVKRLLAVTHDATYRALFAVAVATGLRKGELLGLRWPDVDLDAGLLTVRHALQWVDANPELVEPKTARSRRTIPLAAVALAELRRHREGQTAAPVRSAYVFASAAGRPIPALEREAADRTNALLGGPLERRGPGNAGAGERPLPDVGNRAAAPN